MAAYAGVLTVISEFLTVLHTATADCLLQKGFVLLDLAFLVWLSSDGVQGGHTVRVKLGLSGRTRGQRPVMQCKERQTRVAMFQVVQRLGTQS